MCSFTPNLLNRGPWQSRLGRDCHFNALCSGLCTASFGLLLQWPSPQIYYLIYLVDVDVGLCVMPKDGLWESVLATLWVPGIELRSLVLAASAFICWAVLPQFTNEKVIFSFLESFHISVAFNNERKIHAEVIIWKGLVTFCINSRVKLNFQSIEI